MELSAVRLHSTAISKPTAQHDDDGFGVYDITVRDGRIASVTPSLA